MTALRRALQGITERSRDAHRAEVEALRRATAHSIEVLTNDNAYLSFNCVMHAFGIEQDARYIRLARLCLELDPNCESAPEYQGVHADTGFVEFLISGGFVFEVKAGNNGDVAVYYFDGRVKHVGRVIEKSRVASKWGLGHLYVHGLAEVPSNYGAMVRFFTGLTPTDTLKAFVMYAASKGIRLPSLGLATI